MSGRGLDVVWTVSGGCLEGVLRVGHVRTSQVGADQVKLGQAKSSWDRSSQDWLSFMTQNICDCKIYLDPNWFGHRLFWTRNIIGTKYVKQIFFWDHTFFSPIFFI